MSTTRIVAVGSYSYNGQQANISEIINAASIEQARAVAEAMFARYESRGYAVTERAIIDTTTGLPV